MNPTAACAGSDRKRAIVIGGSIAGLTAAGVLADCFAHVMLIERDQLPSAAEPRKGVPQGRHSHGLLISGRQALEQLFPGFESELIGQGAIPGDVIGDLRWYQHGGYKARFRSGLRGLAMSRPLLEAVLGARIRKLQNVTIKTGLSVRGLIGNDHGTHIIGVHVERATGEHETLPADLVVDASGRGSRGAAWLESLGYARPDEEIVTVGVGYTTRIYQRRPEDLQGDKGVVILPLPPGEKRTGAMVPIEGDRWIVTLGGWLGDHPPSDLAGFRAFARSLPAPDIYDAIKDVEPLSDSFVHKFPSNLRRRYDRMPRFPSGYLVIGDALCSFNPIYGQGMAVAALEGVVLRATLGEQADHTGLARRFFRRAAAIIDLPWALATGADFNYPDVHGRRPRGTKAISWYTGAIHQAAKHDPIVCHAFSDVANLVKSPASLFHPRIAVRVLASGYARRL